MTGLEIEFVNAFFNYLPFVHPEEITNILILNL